MQGLIEFKRIDSAARKWLRPILAALFIFMTAHLQAADNDAYWKAVLERVNVVYSVKNDHATGVTDEHKKEGDQLRSEVVQRLKDDPSFSKLVRQSLRNDTRVWVRAFSASMLITAFERSGVDDNIYILSDPDPDVRGFAILSIRVFKIQDAVCSLPAGLLSKQAAERSSSLRGIRDLLGWKGLPYYAQLLYDADPEVASEAAKAFRSCKIADSAPHLLEYLRKYGKSRGKKMVTRDVVDTLFELHGESVPGKLVLSETVNEWIVRLETETNSK